MSHDCGVRRAFGLLACVVATALPWPASVRGCSSDSPTFQEAILGAEAIALVEVVDMPDDPMNTGKQTLKVREVLKGSLPSTVVLNRPPTGLCGDTIGFWAEQMRTPLVLVAFGVPFYEATINPLWGEPISGDAVFGTAGVPAGARNLDDVMAAARGLLPDAAMDRQSPRVDLALLGAALLALAGVLVFAAGGGGRFGWDCGIGRDRRARFTPGAHRAAKW